MQAVDQVLEARWVVPVEPHGVVLEDHAVALVGDAIVDILPVAQAREKYPDARRVDLPEHALIPGLVNAHTHNAMTLMRGLADDLPLMTWLQQHVWPEEARVMGPEFVRDGESLPVGMLVRVDPDDCAAVEVNDQAVDVFEVPREHANPTAGRQVVDWHRGAVDVRGREQSLGRVARRSALGYAVPACR